MLRILPASLIAFLLVAAPALAQQTDNGEGLIGETDDKQVTFFAFGVLFFFLLVCTVGTTIQSRLEKRKEQAKADHLRQQAGW
jgi:hypothetical protein